MKVKTQVRAGLLPVNTTVVTPIIRGGRRLGCCFVVKPPVKLLAL